MTAVRLGRAEIVGIAHRLPVDRQARRLAHALVGPRRFRVPHVEEIEHERRDPAGEDQLQLRIVSDRLAELSFEQIGDIDFAAFQHRQARRSFRHAQKHEALNRRHLAPVFLVGLHHDLDARLHADEFVGAEADRVLLETVGSDLLEIFLRRDPARAARERAIERHEIRPRFVQNKAHRVRIDRDDLLHLLVQFGALRAPEAEDHVIGGERVAVMEFEALAQLEFVAELVRALASRTRRGSAPFAGPASASPARRAARTVPSTAR